MAGEQQKLTLKDLTTASKKVLIDLRKLQKEGLTLPDILYNYRLQDGHLVKKRKRAGSFAGDGDNANADVKEATLVAEREKRDDKLVDNPNDDGVKDNEKAEASAR